MDRSSSSSSSSGASLLKQLEEIDRAYIIDRVHITDSVSSGLSTVHSLPCCNAAPRLAAMQQFAFFYFILLCLIFALILPHLGGIHGLTGKQQWCCTCYRKGYQMQNANTTATTATTPAKKVVAPATTAPAKAQAPQAPLFVMGPWPVKAQGGNSIRGYCYSVAKALAKAHPGGFTAAQYASALAGNAAGSTYKQPSAGWGTAAKPNGNALAHANWFAHAKQGWLAPAPAPTKAPAKA